LSIDSDLILNTVENNKDYFWSHYTNGFNPDGTKAEATIDGALLCLGKEDRFHIELSKVINECLIHYLHEHNDNIPLKNLDIEMGSGDSLEDKRPLHIRKYFAGSAMSKHSDSILNYHGGGYTILFYFNENFGGGEINFPNENVIVKPKKSSLLIFPENHEHEVLYVEDGVRYMTSAYLYRNLKRIS
jgi:hypothetical protein